jgi:hypothetical protein
MPNRLSRRNLAAVTRLPADRLSHRVFFFSEALPQGAYNVHHAYAPIERIPVTFEQVPGWPGSIATFASTILPLEGGGYRLYGTVRPDAPAEGLEMRAWDSPDGLHWAPVAIRPAGGDAAPSRLIIDGVPGDSAFMGQPQVVPLRDGRWRAYFWKHRDGHLRYVVAETGAAESEDGLRWQVPDFDRPALYHPSEGGLWRWAQGLAPEMVAETLTLSPEEALRHKRLSSNDATYVYYNERLDRYECYSVWLHPAVSDRRVDVDNAPGVHRLLHRRVSRDGLDWGDPELILMPDARDPWDVQFYYMAMQWHEDWQIASVGYYRVEGGQQTQDLMLCFSRDGRHWQRPVRGGLIPRRPGEVDSMGIYAPNVWLDLGERWLILYTGTPDAHNAPRESRRAMAPLGATLGKNRFVGLAAGATPGGFLSEPLIPAAPQITVDADIRGWLRAELCDAFGRKLPGHHLMDAVPIHGDSGAHVLRWRDQATDGHRYEAVRLRFEFAEGVIYGVGF